RVLLEEALALQRQVGHKRYIAIVLDCLAEVGLEEGQYDEASVLLKESLTLCQEVGATTIAYPLQASAHVAAWRTQFERAVRLWAAAQAHRLAELGESDSAHPLVQFADGVTGRAQLERAVQLWAAAQAHRDDLGALWLLEQQRGYERILAPARAELGEATF